MNDADIATLINELKVKRFFLAIKADTKFDKIRSLDGNRNTNCKVDSQSMLLKFKFMRKA